MKISINSAVFAIGPFEKNPIPWKDVLRRLAKVNFDGLELPAVKPYGVLEDFPTLAARKKLIKEVEDAGLKIPIYGAGFNELSPVIPEQKMRDNYRKRFLENLQFCVDCEIPSMRVDTVIDTIKEPFPSNINYDEAVKWLVDTWYWCAEKADKEKINIYWEFEPGFVMNKPSQVVEIVNKINHPRFKILFDTSHAHMCASIGAKQNPPIEKSPNGEIDLIHHLGNHIGYIHLIDSDGTLHDNWTSTHASFGKGEVDFDAVIDALLEERYSNEWWSIDPCFNPESWNKVEEFKQFVESLLKRHGVK